MEIIVDVENIRLDSYLTDKLNLSRSKVSKMIKDCKVLVNGKTVKTSYLLKLDDSIEKHQLI